jgi:hypothetical protein
VVASIDPLLAKLANPAVEFYDWGQSRSRRKCSDRSSAWVLRIRSRCHTSTSSANYVSGGATPAGLWHPLTSFGG